MGVKAVETQLEPWLCHPYKPPWENSRNLASLTGWWWRGDSSGPGVQIFFLLLLLSEELYLQPVDINWQPAVTGITPTLHLLESLCSKGGSASNQQQALLTTPTKQGEFAPQSPLYLKLLGLLKSTLETINNDILRSN